MIHALLPAIVPALSVPAVPEAVHLVADPAAGTYERTFTASRAFDGGDMSVVMNGQEVPKMFLPKLEYQSEVTLSLTLEDTQGEEHTRTFTEGAMGFSMDMTFGEESGMPPIDVETSASCELEGHAVRFEEEDGELLARWVEDEDTPDDALLEGLAADLHCANLLPEKPVEPGVKWSADAAALRPLLRPSGDLTWRWDDGTSDPDTAAYSGDLTLRLVEVVKEEGQRLARITIEGDLVETTVRATDLAEVPVADGDATETTKTEYAVDGELLWDLERNALHSIELTGEGDGTQATVKDPGQEGGDYASTLRHTAKLEVSVR